MLVTLMHQQDLGRITVIETSNALGSRIHCMEIGFREHPILHCERYTLPTRLRRACVNMDGCHYSSFLSMDDKCH